MISERTKEYNDNPCPSCGECNPANFDCYDDVFCKTCFNEAKAELRKIVNSETVFGVMAPSVEQEKPSLADKG